MWVWIHRVVNHFVPRIEEWWAAIVALFMLHLIQQILVPHHSQVVEERSQEQSENDGRDCAPYPPKKKITNNRRMIPLNPVIPMRVQKGKQRKNTHSNYARYPPISAKAPTLCAPYPSLPSNKARRSSKPINGGSSLLTQPVSFPNSNEDFLARSYRLKFDQENEMKFALSKAWRFVEDLQTLVWDFQNKDYLSSPLVFGNNDIVPHYEAMIRKIYKQQDPDKLVELKSILKKYKGKETELFRSLASKYQIRNPLEVFYGRNLSASTVAFGAPDPATSTGFGGRSSNNTDLVEKAAVGSSPFGLAAASSGAFANSSPFGGNTTLVPNGAFGAPLAAQSQSPFATAASAPPGGFGRQAQALSSSTFGAFSSSNANSNPKQPPFDGGSVPPTSTFGNATPSPSCSIIVRLSPSPFGGGFRGIQNNASIGIGAASTLSTVFGRQFHTTNNNISNTGFGGQPAAAISPFGSGPAASSGFGAGGEFGRTTTTHAFGGHPQATGGMFGTPIQTFGPLPPLQVREPGTRVAPIQAQSRQDGSRNIRLHSILAMHQYADRSFDELRFEDYCQGNKGNDCPLKILANDDLVFLAERIFLRQEIFCSDDKCRRVDIGYHYTKPEYLNRIRTDGLLNQKERSSKQISSNYNGSRYGEGIYTANDAHSFSDYGSVGLMVLRLKGESMDAKEAGRGYDNGNDSITSRKRPSLLVLKDCSQCLPVIQFPAEEFSTSQEGLARLRLFERKLQCLVEDYFHRNENTRLKSSADRVNYRRCNVKSRARKKMPKLVYTPQIIAYEAPATFNKVDLTALCIDVGIHCVNIEDKCPICVCTYNLSSKKVALKSCGHEFHKDCAIPMLATSHLCPICRSPQDTIRGKMPSGIMTVTIDKSKHCEGSKNYSTIVIDYEIFAGMQKDYHEEPGQRHSSASRTAFIPYTSEGIGLSYRLQEAFRRGLTFTVGTSMTSGERNQVVWSSIHHKTKLNGGTENYGYPDLTYINRCNHELDTFGVP